MLIGLTPPSLRPVLPSVRQYYEKIIKLPNTKLKFNSEETVLKLLNDLDENKAAKINNLSGKFFKDGANILGKPISQTCNLSIKYSMFSPDDKLAKLEPLFKKGAKTASQNYRPISLLPLIS